MNRPLLLVLALSYHHAFANFASFSEGGSRIIADDISQNDESMYDDHQLDRADAYNNLPVEDILVELLKDQRAELQQKYGQAGRESRDSESDAVEVKPKQPAVVNTEKPVITQKKGQNEYVEFVDPQISKQLKNGESMDKRVPVERHDRTKGGAVHAFTTGGNLLFIVAATMCVVASIVGIAGGTYYYYGLVKKHQNSEPNDFTLYNPAGPSKDKKYKKKGDESLAYKAQLHHYQQTKQKIICGEDGQAAPIPDMDENSDNEMSDDEGNNFSVYECPGLAPTGDLEVHNPNFDSRP